MVRWLVGYSVLVLVLFALFPVGIEVVPPPWTATYLSEVPHVELLGVILIKPSSTIIVYGLGILTIVFGVLLYRKKDNQLANLW
jgi:hypothetical protein